MIASPISFSHRAAGRRSDGFTLVELMVALLLSLLLAVAMLKMQTKMASQTMRVSDTGTRDTQARAAMDLITRDLSGAGFLVGNSQYPCDALFTYNSGGSGTKYFVHHGVDAFASVTGTTMNFAPTLTLNYPPAPAGGLVSDVLVTVSSKNSLAFNDITNPIVTTDGGGTPMTTGTLSLAKPTGVVATHAAIVQAPVGTGPTAQKACLRVPVSSVVGTVMTSSPGTTMPAGFYNDFVPQVASAGFAFPLTSAGVLSSFIVDIGTSATSSQVKTVYYIDGSGAYPMLMRAQYSLVDDSVLTAPQPIAAGVVSLRVSFGVDPGNTGGVTAYESGATVTASNHWGAVRSTRIALVTRTINDDPNADSTSYAAPPTIPIGPATGTTWFSSITVPASTHRYVVNTTEVANRNWLWK
jgi:type IV pilus assembly protein PilW